MAIERAALAQKNQGDGAATVVNAKQQKEQEKADREATVRVVFVYADGKVRQVPVETGIADATHIEIKSGVKAGDQVVSGGYAAITRTLKDGLAVTLGPPAGLEKK
jgi:HlyD family secretion protein